MIETRCLKNVVIFVQTILNFILLPFDIKLKKSIVSGNDYMIVYCPQKCKTERMCDEAVDDCLATLKFIHD